MAEDEAISSLGMVTLSQSLALKVRGQVQRLFRKEVLSAHCGKEAPDPVIPLRIRYGNEIVHSSMKIGG